GRSLFGTAIARESGMSLKRVAPRLSLIDVLDRVLDKGLVIDASVRVSLLGIEIVGVDACIVVTSIQTYGQLPSSPPSLRRMATVVLKSGKSGAFPRRRRPRTSVNARCQHGCTFVMKRDALPSTVTCPFDGSRICSVATPAA